MNASAGLEFSSHNCAGVSHQQQEQPPDLSLLSNALQQQWHDKLNSNLGHTVIRPCSNRKVWWSCAECPEGLPHVWQATVNSRTCGAGCPFCSGHSVCQHNSLARKAPEVAALWDDTKNFPLTQSQVTSGSQKIAHWRCRVCLNEWQAKVSVKVHHQTRCPKCAKANAGRTADGTRQKHPIFAKSRHALLQQWDHDRNEKLGNFPDNTSLRSAKLIWWHCLNCPKGKLHSWQARPNLRTRHRRSSGCPFCSGQSVCECNSLESVCPEVAADFDVKKNGVTPGQVTGSTSKPFSWLSDKPGAKKRPVSHRTVAFAMKKKKQGLTVSQLYTQHLKSCIP